MNTDYKKYYDVDDSGDHPLYKSKLKPGFTTPHLNKMHNHIDKRLARKTAKAAAKTTAAEKTAGSKGK